jgi:FTR1 family protein
MFGSAIIVLRETLEAALIVGILLAAVGTALRAKQWIAGGIVVGLIGAGVVALFAESIASAVAGAGQEIFNATVLLTATAMLVWHQVWMRSHGRELAQTLRATGERVSTGTASYTALLVVVALAVMREGSEVALFLYGIAIGGADQRQILSGGILGLLVGIALGALTYTGLARIPQRKLFAVTGWLLTLLAAGMAAQAAGYLSQAGLVPALTDSWTAPLWDTSSVVSERGPLGQVLHVLIGYNERPSGVQMLFFVVTTMVIVTLSFYVDKRLLRLRTSGTAASATTGTATSVVSSVSVALLSVCGLLYGNPAHAAHKVYSPIVEEGELAIELRGHEHLDADPNIDRNQQYKVELEYAPTARWMTEIIGEFESESGNSLETTAIEWENIFQLTDQGAYWVDVGVLAEYAHELESGKHDKLELGALLEKTLGNQIVTFNVIVERELGGDAETELEYAARWRWRASQAFEPAIEVYGGLGDVDHLNSYSEQEHSAGPGFLGEVALKDGSKVKYEAAYLFGISDAAPNGTLRFLLEYEF